LAFVKKVKGELGVKALHREFERIGGAYACENGVRPTRVIWAAKAPSRCAPQSLKILHSRICLGFLIQVSNPDPSMHRVCEIPPCLPYLPVR
jgi:hypothetical protein